MRELPFEIAHLLYKYRAGIPIEDTENEMLHDWVSSSPQNKTLFDTLFLPEHFIDFSEQICRIDIDKAWSNFLLEKQKQKHRRMRIVYMKYAAMIAIVLGISGGGYWWLGSDRFSGYSSNSQVVEHTDRIEPGRTKALLTLQSGEQIELEKDEALLAEQVEAYAKNAETVEETGKETFSTIETPVGGEYRFILSDKSTICLNSQTTIRFPDKFANNKREIELLQGEIYLDVNSASGTPFFVQVKGLKIRVLGTSFNVSTYDNVYQTTLVQGAVEVSFDTGKTYTLKPSEQLNFEPETDRVQIRQVDTDQYTSWVDGRIVFKDETIESIMNKLSRWYNFSVIYDNPELKTYKFGVHVNKYNNIETFLTVLKATGKLNFEVNGNVIYVKRGIRNMYP